MNRTEPSFLGITKAGAAHSEWLTLRRTPIWQSLDISFFKVSSLDFGIGNALA